MTFGERCFGPASHCSSVSTGLPMTMRFSLRRTYTFEPLCELVYGAEPGVDAIAVEELDDAIRIAEAADVLKTAFFELDLVRCRRWTPIAESLRASSWPN